MNNIVLNIVSKKQNLSYPFIFKKISKYYWNEKQFFKVFDIKRSILINFCIKNKLYKTFDFFKEQCLFSFACARNDLDTVKYLLKNYKIDVNYDYNDAFSAAMRNNSVKVLKYLYDENLINNGDGHFHNIEYALKNNNLDIVYFLLEKGVHNSDIVTRACIIGHLNTVKYFIENNLLSNDQKTDALNSACRYGQLEIVKYLVQNGVDPTHGLDTAYNSHNLELIKYLIEKGADINVMVRNKRFDNTCNIDIMDYVSQFIFKN